jgi:hypothetical protein
MRNSSYGTCRCTYPRNGEADAWARSPLIEKTLIILNTQATSFR